jgi:hypothetical protein
VIVIFTNYCENIAIAATRGHTRAMRSAPAIVLLVSFFGIVASIRAQTAAVVPPVDARAVWQPDADTLKKARSACTSVAYSELGNCFLRQMQEAGASPEAVGFLRSMHNDAYLAKYENTGRVSIAWVIYPFRANANTAGLLVNGTPPSLDVDDLSRLPRDRLISSSKWRALVARYPKATLWPDDRSGMTGIHVASLPGGGQRFVVNYLALDGCHACARLALIRYAFDFDVTARLLGVRFIDLQALP